MTSEAELDPAAVELDTYLSHPPPTVWRALTDPELVELWLMRSIGLSPVVGATFVFVVPSEPTAEIACEILTVRPVEQLTHTWVDLRADTPARWVLDWSIHPHGRGTRLLLTQTGFDITDHRQRMARNALERGWSRTVLPRLADILDLTNW